MKDMNLVGDKVINHRVGKGKTVYRNLYGYDIIGGISAETTLVVRGSQVLYQPPQIFWPHIEYYMGR